MTWPSALEKLRLCSVSHGGTPAVPFASDWATAIQTRHGIESVTLTAKDGSAFMSYGTGTTRIRVARCTVANKALMMIYASS